MISFGELVNIENFGEKKSYFDLERGDITFYCKNCKKIIEIERKKNKGYKFKCKNCNSTNVAIGTEKGIKEKYHIN